MSKSKTYLIHLRRFAKDGNRVPIGTLAVMQHADEDKIAIACAICSDKDQFSYKTGRDKAIGQLRAQAKPSTEKTMREHLLRGAPHRVVYKKTDIVLGMSFLELFNSMGLYTIQIKELLVNTGTLDTEAIETALLAIVKQINQDQQPVKA